MKSGHVDFVSSESVYEQSRLGQKTGCMGGLGLEVGNGLGRVKSGGQKD